MIIVELYLSFLKIGAFSIGGGYVMLPLIQQEIIENRAWLTLSEFLNILAIAEMTPGPVAINSATFIGYQAGGFWGAAFATAGVVTPSLVLMVAAATLLSRFYENRWVQACLDGLRPAVLALIASAAIFVAESAVVDILSATFFATAMALLLLTRIHPVLALLLAATAGIIFYL
ncbi:MAG: chromate transporter [Dethiobacter sp.]|nr:chromate transporter [Dethiobacter sp.]MBS3897593.1 chromate transporter [Dethiobacter sp.]